MTARPVLAGPFLDCRADLDPEDSTIEVVFGLMWSFSTISLADGSEALVRAFWSAVARYLHEDVDRQLRGSSVDRDALAGRLCEVLEPVSTAVERAVLARFRAMVDELGLAHERLTRAVAR